MKNQKSQKSLTDGIQVGKFGYYIFKWTRIPAYEQASRKFGFQFLSWFLLMHSKGTAVTPTT